MADPVVDKRAETERKLAEIRVRDAARKELKDNFWAAMTALLRAKGPLGAERDVGPAVDRLVSAYHAANKARVL